MKLDLPITVDRGVSLPADDKPRGIYHPFLRTLQEMNIGDSFFREGETREDLTGLLRYAKRNGIHLRAVDQDEDEVYLMPGVRVERVSQDDLPGPKPKVADDDKTYWRLGNGPCARVMTLPVGSVPEEDSEWTQVTAADYKRLVKLCPDHNTYWYHGETDSVWAQPRDHEFQGDGLSNEIELEQFIAMSKQGKLIEAHHAQSQLEATTYWRNKVTKMIMAYLPGKRPQDKENWIESDIDEYRAHIAGEELPPIETKVITTTWWKKSNGVCVIVPPEKYQVALKTKGAVQISEAEYLQYRADLDAEEV